MNHRFWTEFIQHIQEGQQILILFYGLHSLSEHEERRTEDNSVSEKSFEIVPVGQREQVFVLFDLLDILQSEIHRFL